jgi:predicted Zn-dependent protease
VDLGVLRLAAGHPAEALSQLDLAVADGTSDRRAELHRAIALQQLERAAEAEPILTELAGCDDPGYAEHARILLAGRNPRQLDRCRPPTRTDRV